MNCGEITDTDAVERSFQFSRIFNFHDIGLDILVRQLLDDGVGSLLGGLDTDLDYVLAIFFGLNAAGRQLNLLGLGGLALLCRKGLDRYQFGLVCCRCLGFSDLGGLLDGHLGDDVLLAAFAGSQHKAGESCGNQCGNRE